MDGKLYGVLKRFIVSAKVVPVSGPLVRKKYPVKLSALERPSHLLPNFGLSVVIPDIVLGMRPGPDRMVHGAVNHEAYQMHHLFHFPSLSLLTLLGVLSDPNGLGTAGQRRFHITSLARRLSIASVLRPSSRP